MDSDIVEPMNIGSTSWSRINQLVDIVEEIAGDHGRASLRSRRAARAFAGRNSDNTMIKAELGWEPSIRLETGLAETYKWIYDQLASR